MDSLSQLQLTMLETGGNLQLQTFFAFYDLNYEPIQRRYHTKAAEFYRLKLRELAEKGVSRDGKELDFTGFKEKPGYEEGRQPCLTVPRSSVEVFQQIENR